MIAPDPYQCDVLWLGQCRAGGAGVLWAARSSRIALYSATLARIGLALFNVVALASTVARRSTDDIYLSSWYTIGGVLWTCIIAVVAVLPWYQYGLGQVPVSGYYLHDAVGMWLTPLALGIFYYALSSLLNRPIYSYPAVWYAARMWDVPAESSQKPTCRSQPAGPAR